MAHLLLHCTQQIYKESLKNIHTCMKVLFFKILLQFEHCCIITFYNHWDVQWDTAVTILLKTYRPVFILLKKNLSVTCVIPG